MNILITGCNGQLGNEMQLLQQANSQHTFFNTDVADLDITDAQAISAFVNEHEIDGIVNCAAYTAVDRAESNEELCTLLNAKAPAYLAEAIALVWICHRHRCRHERHHLCYANGLWYEFYHGPDNQSYQ